MPKRVIVFDVNETLLDLRALRPQFERVFGDGDVLYRWFGHHRREDLIGRTAKHYDLRDIPAVRVRIAVA